MDKKDLYGKMQEGKISGIESIAAGGLTTDLEKWASVKSAEFAKDVLNGKLPDFNKLSSGHASGELGKWAEHNKEAVKEAAGLRKNSDLEKMIAGAVKETMSR